MGITSLSQALNATPPGLALVTTSTFSAASTVSINGCFTSAYSDYRIVCVVTSSSATDSNCNMRLRASGSDDSTASAYLRQKVEGGGSSTAASLTTTDLWTMATLTSAADYSSTFSFDLFGPQVTAKTVGNCVLTQAISVPTYYAVAAMFRHTQSTAYDGFSLLCSSGTMTGSVSVYGYRRA